MRFFSQFLCCCLISLMMISPSISADRPNVLFIISDDLSAEALACYGNQQCRTLHIDQLAESGMMFHRAYCQYPVCGPSRAALMSGMYPQAIGVTGNGSSTKFTEALGSRPSFSQHFKQHGYYSARVSKIYHMRVPGDITAGVDGPDHEASWTERFNCHAPEWMSKGEHEHLSNEKLRFDPDVHYKLGFGGAFYVVKGSTDGTEQADMMAAAKACDLLEEHQNESFFLAVGLVRPHVPFVAPVAYFEPYVPAEISLPQVIQDDQKDIPKLGIPKTSQKMGMVRKSQKQKGLAAYYACVEFMDAQVGRIIQKLDELQLRKNTIIVFTSDHGYHLGEHDFWQKMSLHEESTRIPLIIHAPNIAPGNTDSLAQQIDIYPTLAELSGLTIPPHIQGRSLVPAIEDPSASVHDSVYTFRSNGHLLRTDRWAYISYKDGSHELYDMENDPEQITNLADQSEWKQRIKQLNDQLEAKLAEMKQTP